MFKTIISTNIHIFYSLDAEEERKRFFLAQSPEFLENKEDNRAAQAHYGLWHRNLVHIVPQHPTGRMLGCARMDISVQFKVAPWDSL